MTDIKEIITHDFQRKYTFEQRSIESKKIMKKYPDRIPIIVEVSQHNQKMLKLDKKKFLVPKKLTMGEFLFLVRKRLKITPHDAIFLFTNNNTLCPTSSVVSDIFDKYKSNSNFLLLFLSKESTFGL